MTVSKLEDAAVAVIMRLTAWADDAELKARWLPDSEAQKYRNMEENYRILAKKLSEAVEP